MRPTHLAPLAAVFERAERGPVYATVSVPPRHSKTETILHAIARWLLRHPDQTVAYVAFGDRLTKSKSRFARDYARRAGVRLRDDATSLNEWRTVEGGGALFTSVGGPFTGQGCNLLVVDDPHKDRAEAESQIIRDGVHDWFTGTAGDRLEPGSSIIVCHTRWHPDDLIGRLSQDPVVSWERIVLPALSDAGEALWPERWPASELQRKRDIVGPYEWASKYLGLPRARGGTVFHDAHFFGPTARPARFRVGIGVDLAYTAKTYADHSVAVVLAEIAGKYYVLDVRRAQVEAPDFAATLRQLGTVYPGAPMLALIGGTEKGVTDFLVRQRVPLRAEPAKSDKFVRAQPVAAAWNAGRVLLPEGATWAPAFVSELMTFTGVADKHDDQVDALAAAFAALTAPVQRRDLRNLPPG